MSKLNAIALGEFLGGIGEYSKTYSLPQDFYNHIGELNTGSPQEEACQRDWIYLRKVSTILHVIMSIISHPHISNKREEIVARIEQAKQLSNEEFTRVMQDGSMWKRHDVKMVPETVYYYQHVDELVIYENQFICLTIDLIDKDLLEFAGFYVKMLPSMKNGILLRLDSARPQRILRYVDLLRRRIIYLKNTYFYKEVSKKKQISRNVARTNILLKDNLYSQVYRFYREFLSKEDKNVAFDALSKYYFVLLLQDFLRHDFKFVGTKGTAYILENQHFICNLGFYKENRGFELSVHEKLTDLTANHLVLLSQTKSFTDIQKPSGNWDSIEALSIWGKIYADVKGDDFEEIFQEGKIIRLYLKDKIGLSIMDQDIYGRYCPVCRAKGLRENESVYTCSNCSSKFVFTKVNDQDFATWFLRYRSIK